MSTYCYTPSGPTPGSTTSITHGCRTLVGDATQAVIDLSFAGIRRRHPTASDREFFLRFACIVLGRDVARNVYPDVAHLAATLGVLDLLARAVVDVKA